MPFQRQRVEVRSRIAASRRRLDPTFTLRLRSKETHKSDDTLIYTAAGVYKIFELFEDTAMCKELGKKTLDTDIIGIPITLWWDYVGVYLRDAEADSPMLEEVRLQDVLGKVVASKYFYTTMPKEWPAMQIN